MITAPPPPHNLLAAPLLVHLFRWHGTRLGRAEGRSLLNTRHASVVGWPALRTFGQERSRRFVDVGGVDGGWVVNSVCCHFSADCQPFGGVRRAQGARHHQAKIGER